MRDHKILTKEEVRNTISAVIKDDSLVNDILERLFKEENKGYQHWCIEISVKDKEVSKYFCLIEDDVIGLVFDAHPKMARRNFKYKLFEPNLEKFNKELLESLPSTKDLPPVQWSNYEDHNS